MLVHIIRALTLSSVVKKTTQILLIIRIYKAWKARGRQRKSVIKSCKSKWRNQNSSRTNKNSNLRMQNYNHCLLQNSTSMKNYKNNQINNLRTHTMTKHLSVDFHLNQSLVIKVLRKGDYQWMIVSNLNLCNLCSSSLITLAVVQSNQWIWET